MVEVIACFWAGSQPRTSTSLTWSAAVTRTENDSSPLSQASSTGVAVGRRLS